MRLDILKHVVAFLVKAGTDPTAAVAQIVQPVAERRWRRASRDALLALLAELEAARARDEGKAPAGAGGPAGARLLGLLAAAALADFAGRLEAPLSPEEQRIVRSASERLLLQGADGLDQPFDTASGAYAEALAAAERDLLQVLIGRLDVVRIDVESIVRQGLAGTLAPAEVEAQLKALLNAPGTDWISRSVEAWAFRWRNVGSIDAAQQAGILRLRVVNNPPRGPDAKSTPFCRWMHGRTISVAQAAEQTRRYQQAVLAGDTAGARAAWPLLDRARLSREADFPLTEATVGLPPYHFGCRDTLEAL